MQGVFGGGELTEETHRCRNHMYCCLLFKQRTGMWIITVLEIAFAILLVVSGGKFTGLYLPFVLELLVIAGLFYILLWPESLQTRQWVTILYWFNLGLTFWMIVFMNFIYTYFLTLSEDCVDGSCTGTLFLLLVCMPFKLHWGWTIAYYFIQKREDVIQEKINGELNITQQELV